MTHTVGLQPRTVVDPSVADTQHSRRWSLGVVPPVENSECSERVPSAWGADLGLDVEVDASGVDLDLQSLVRWMSRPTTRRRRCLAAALRRHEIPPDPRVQLCQGPEVIVSSIETERLVLRPLHVNDADEMATVLADSSLYEFTGGKPPTASELANLYQQQTAGPGTPGEHWCNWIIRVGSEGRAVGFVQATVVGDLADLAWVLGAPDQRHGFATEAVMAVCEWLAENSVRRIEAHIHPRHEASQAVAQRIGMVRTGECDDEDEEIWAAEVPLLRSPLPPGVL